MDPPVLGLLGNDQQSNADFCRQISQPTEKVLENVKEMENEDGVGNASSARGLSKSFWNPKENSGLNRIVEVANPKDGTLDPNIESFLNLSDDDDANVEANPSNVWNLD